MANTTMGNRAQVTPTSQADTAHFIYIILMLENAEHSETLGRMIYQPVHHAEGVFDALCAGRFALLYVAHHQAEIVRDYGQLLFAFDGSTVLQGGAA